MLSIPAFIHDFDNMSDAEDYLDEIDKEKKLVGVSLTKSGEILIFADRIGSEEEVEGTIFHENVHSWLRRQFGPEQARSICENFWNATSGKYGEFQKAIVEGEYKDHPEWQQHEELFAYFMEIALTTGRFGLIDKYLTDDLDRHYLNKLLNFIKYDRREEKKNRRSSKGKRGGGKTLGEAQAPEHQTFTQSENDGTSETSDGGGRADGGVAPSDEDLLFNDSDDDVDVAGFDAGRQTFEESITAGMLKAAADNRAALAARTAAMRALGGNLSKLRQAMASQREYDRGTVDSIVRLARSVMESGFFRGFSPYEVKRLMSLINHAAGREGGIRVSGGAPRHSEALQSASLIICCSGCFLVVQVV